MVSNLKSITLTLSVILLKFLVNVQGDIPPGLSIVSGDKQYYIGNVLPVTWYRAAHICASLGMTLASIESETELRQLSSALTTYGILDKGYWLSGNDLSTSNTKYSWFGTGKPIGSYTNWATSPPSKTGQCVATDASFKWLEIDCTTADTYYYICSKPLLPLCGSTNQCYYTFSYNN